MPVSPPAAAQIFSALGDRMARGSGIDELMHDLGLAMAEGGGDWLMLGGGQPSAIPAMQQRWRELASDMLAHEPHRFDRMLGVYDPQQGNTEFIEALAALFNRHYGWNLAPDNIAITNGGQTAFFMLFNLLAGKDTCGRRRRIVFPLMPEYIGYAEQGLEPGMLSAIPARIEDDPLSDPLFFKYRIDFDALPQGPEIAAYCISRPTNPTANVLEDEEIRHLHQIARANGSLLLIDNAYGTPFPGIVFRDDINPFWDEGVVLTYSLSKLGLPGTRTGMVIAPSDVIRALSRMNSVVGLANGSIGQALTLPLMRSGELLELCAKHVRPFYESRRNRAIEMFREAFRGLPLRIHRADGALFLWLWFPGLPVTSHELYRRLKQSGVLVVPGHHFSHSLPQPWTHPGECVRINHSLQIERLPEAASRIADAIRQL